MRTLAAIALGACSSGAPSHLASQPIVGHAETAQRATPAPKVVWKDGTFVTDTLPAVGHGGEVVVVPLRAGDGGRGYPNLTLELRDRGDHTIQKIDVMSSNEFETLAPAGTPSPALQHRIDTANNELARLHGLHDLVAMHALEIQPPTGDDPKHLAIGDGLDVDWNQDHLHVFHHNTDRSFVTVDGSKWLVAPRSTIKGEPPCENPAYLAGVYHASEISAIVVEIGYKGTDTCWEPGDELHVISW